MLVLWTSISAAAGSFHCEMLFLKKPFSEAILSNDNIVYDFRKKDVFRVVHVKSDFYFIAKLSPDGELEMDFRGVDPLQQTRSGLFGPRLYREAIRYFGRANIAKITIQSREKLENQ